MKLVIFDLTKEENGNIFTAGCLRIESRFSNKMVKNGNDSNDFGKKSVILRK